jgi:hypothetical protein
VQNRRCHIKGGRFRSHGRGAAAAKRENSGAFPQPSWLRDHPQRSAFRLFGQRAGEPVEIAVIETQRRQSVVHF